MKPERVQVPGFLPDTAEVRNDLLDYYFEVQRFDRDLGRISTRSSAPASSSNTIVIVTSDNGMPFPRAKANVYDAGARVPLAIRWPGVRAAGAVVDAFVSLTDLAPTILEGAGLKPLDAMTGRSLLPLLRGESQPGRDRVFIERERHANVRRGDLSYPVRAIRTKDYLYIRNFRPDRWPAGDPEQYVAVGPFGDIDGGPSKSVLLDRRTDRGDRSVLPARHGETSGRGALRLAARSATSWRTSPASPRTAPRSSASARNWIAGCARPATRARRSTTTAGIDFRTTAQPAK